VTSRQSSGQTDADGIWEQVGDEAATGEESELRAEARGKAAASYPIVLRSYEPAADLDERLQRIFAALSLPPVQEGTCSWTSSQRFALGVHQQLGRAFLGDGFWGQVRGFSGRLRALGGRGASGRRNGVVAGKTP
jgi:hypothetical protein